MDYWLQSAQSGTTYVKGVKIEDEETANPLLLVELICVALVIVIRSFQLPAIERHVAVGCVLVAVKYNKGWNESYST